MITRDNFCQFCTKTYVVTPHLNRLNERLQHMVSVGNKKNCHSVIIRYSFYLELYFMDWFWKKENIADIHKTNIHMIK